MVLLAVKAHVEARFSPFGGIVNLDAWLLHGLRWTYHRLRNVLDAPNGTPCDEAQVEASFGSFGDSANLDAR